MRVDQIPPEIASRLDEQAGMEHRREGRVFAALAELLTMYESMRPPTCAAMLAEWSEATGGDNLSLVKWAELRKELLMRETEEACEAIDTYVETGDAQKLAKELADVHYVLEGTAQRPRINLIVAFQLVHDSNMSKIGPDGSYEVRADGKILKGPHYYEPDMAPAVGGNAV